MQLCLICTIYIVGPTGAMRPAALPSRSPGVQCRVHRAVVHQRGQWHQRLRSVCTRASAQSSEVYQGRFGPWQIDAADVAEVWGYRGAISVVALSALAVSSPAFLPDGDLRTSVLSASDAVCAAGAGGLAVALVLIHIYLTPLKRLLQALAAAGTLGGAYLIATQDTPLPLYVALHPEAVWLIGPLLAAITGVAFKEGLCYGKWEAAGLFGALPLLSLGHLTQVLPPEGERAMLAAVLTLLTVFAARKYTQPIKDDIGDKSVFTFMKLSREEQERLLAQQGVADD